MENNHSGMQGAPKIHLQGSKFPLAKVNKPELALLRFYEAENKIWGEVKSFWYSLTSSDKDNVNKANKKFSIY